MARIRKNDTRPGIPTGGAAPAGQADLAQWRDSDAHADIKRFIVRYGRVGSRERGRACSEATMTGRRKMITHAFDLLAKANRGVRTLADLKPKQLPLIIHTWTQQHMAPRTQVQYFAALKWFWRMHGLPDVGCIKDHTHDPQRYVVRAAAQSDRGVSARVDDVMVIFARLDAIDERAGMFARLAWALGLRKLECLRLQPHEDFNGQTLEIVRGAKGGRARSVSLVAAGEQRAELARHALQRLRVITPAGQHAGWPDRTLEQSKYHFEYIMRCAGLTKAQLGATFHGFRHDYACDRLEELSGITAPVRGGLCVDYRALHEHQKLVSRQLGHNRAKITAAYYGSMREMNKIAAARVLRSWEMLRPGLDGALEILRRHGLRQLYLTGLRAMGTNTSDSAQFDFAVPDTQALGAPQIVLLLQELQRHWQRVLFAPTYIALALTAPGRRADKLATEAQRWQMPLFATEHEPGQHSAASHAAQL